MPALINPGFETGNLSGWDVEVYNGGVGGYEFDPNVNQAQPLSGAYSVEIGGGDPFINGYLKQDTAQIVLDDSLIVRTYIRGSESAGVGRDAAQWQVRVIIEWYDQFDVLISTEASVPTGALANQWKQVGLESAKPATATKAKAAIQVFKTTTFGLNSLYIDEFSWSNDTPAWQGTLVSPPNNSTWAPGAVVPLSVSTTTPVPAITSVEYFVEGVSVATSNTAPFSATYIFNTEGTYDVTATVTLSDGQEVNLGPNTVTIDESGTLEYKASNSYTYLVASDFQGLSALMPSTALVTGVELLIDYDVHAIVRCLNRDNPDPNVAVPEVVFDITEGGEFEVVLLNNNGDNYSILGTPITAPVPLDREDFTLTSTGLSEGKRLAVMESEGNSVTIGSDTGLFGQEPIGAVEFTDKAFGIRFYPRFGSVPSYTADGDAAFRMFLNKVRLRVYFDAGSVLYYFASPDKTQVIQGTLVSSNVTNGNFRTGDASGMLQLTEELVVLDGTQTWIGNDWTIHAAYPPTAGNQIGEVDDILDEPEVGMEYNGLSTQSEVLDNRSRYMFITANFYGDKNLDAIYGVNGLDRAFAYNGNWFYKIYTQPDEDKDRPRHVAYHHWHLALGFDEGRVDISVVGEPYNYDGVFGASSHTIGDKVVGLLPLSGTILGVFGSKSIWGIAGTTVDNFATQVISPNIGAIEYTICDMGFPVYANSYGIYTLSQTQQYGDYMGTPMSQDISPWLRPRLVRKYTSDREVVVAWPVRSKNQYRLSFKDGNVVTMTLNGQQVPTFSKQKYFYEPRGLFIAPDDLYEYPAIVPAAVSSQLDEHGQERIHVAPVEDTTNG